MTRGALSVTRVAFIALGLIGGLVLAVQHDLWARFGVAPTHGFCISVALGLLVALAGMAIHRAIDTLSPRESAKPKNQEERNRRRREERRREPSAKIATFDGALTACLLMFISPMVLILPFGKVGADGESKLDWEALSATWDASLEGKVFIVLLTLLPPLLGLLGAIQLSGEDGEALKELPKRALDALLRRDHEIEEDLRDGVAHPLRRVWWTPREKAYFKGYLVRAAGLLLVLSGILGALGLIGSSSPPQTNAAGYSRLRVICLLMMLGSLAGVALVWWGGKFEFGSHVDSERVTELRNAAAQSSPSAKIAIAHNAVFAVILTAFLLPVLLPVTGLLLGSASMFAPAPLSIAFGALLIVFSLLCWLREGPDEVMLRETPQRLRKARYERRRVAEKMIRQEGQVTIADSLAERGDLSEPEQTR